MGRLTDLFMGRGEPVEVRSESSYTDTLVDLIVARAGGQVVKVAATGALEAVAGLVGRSFAAAEVEAPPPLAEAFGPLVRSLVGRALIRSGETVLAFDVGGRRITLRPASSWDISGSYDPATWTYDLSLAGPSNEIRRRRVSGAEVLHLRYQVDPERPWHGIGPIESASLPGKLSAEVSAALPNEAGSPHGHLLPMPVDGEDPTIAKLKADLRKLRGGLAMVESQATGNWTADQRMVPRDGGWSPQRIGANPPAPLVELYQAATREVWAACGVSPALFSTSDGTASREAWRQFFHGVVAPLGELVADEVGPRRESPSPSAGAS